MSEKFIYDPKVVAISHRRTDWRLEGRKVVGVPVYEVVASRTDGEVLSVEVKESGSRVWFD